MLKAISHSIFVHKSNTVGRKWASTTGFKEKWLDFNHCYPESLTYSCCGSVNLAQKGDHVLMVTEVTFHRTRARIQLPWNVIDFLWCSSSNTQPWIHRISQGLIESHKIYTGASLCASPLVKLSCQAATIQLVVWQLPLSHKMKRDGSRDEDDNEMFIA